MRTEDLIKGLSADAAPAAPMARVWLLGLIGAILLAGTVFFATLGMRPDAAAAMHGWRFPFKFVVTVLLGVTAWWAVRRAAMPGAGWAGGPWLLSAPVLLVAAVAVEMLILPPGERMARMMGVNNMLCMVAIPAIGLLPLGVLLAALRHGAPTSPATGGALAGLLAGGIAATFYAAHCADDSPLFVAVWYTAGVLALAAAGAVAGRFWLRW